MKLILSRKGFDSVAGGCASPIFPDRTMCSLPIPLASATKCYDDVRCGMGMLGQIVERLKGSCVRGSDRAHLDPDLDRIALARADEWRPAFGQADSAQSHLRNQAVGPGDLFLFYGWFRHVLSDGVGWQWARPRRDLHVVFGWLQVGEVLDINAMGASRVLDQYPWLCDHPHLNVPASETWSSNVVYIAAEQLNLPGSVGSLPGAGLLPAMHDGAVLTDAASKTRSLWRLPGWFIGDDGCMRLSCNPNATRWSQCGSDILLRSVRSQEQVIDLGLQPRECEAEWISRVVGAGELQSGAGT